MVNGAGTATRLRIPGKDVCVKTGTAQVVRASAGKDPKDLEKSKRDHAWLAGFAPRESPEVAFVVLVEHGGHGGEIAAEIAREALEYLFFGTDTRGQEVESPSPEPLDQALLEPESSLDQDR